MRSKWFNLAIFVTLVLLYVAGQLWIGTYDAADDRYIYDAPADVDFLYYAAIANSLLNHFPPENPAFAGVKLTQPYLQFYPVALLTTLVNPYNAIRVLNVIYLVLMGLMLWRFFPQRFGLALVIMFASSTPAAEINALGVDFIARGFTHLPFFLLVTAALFSKRLWLRMVCVFGAALVNGYMMLMVMPFLFVMFLLQRKREDMYLLLSSLVGMAVASLVISSEVVHKPIYFLFTEGFGFDPWEVLKHAVPFIILSFLYRQRRMTILLAVAVGFGALIHYNPFFPVFMIYFAGALIVASGSERITASGRITAAVVAVIFISFLSVAHGKYSPAAGMYFPRHDDRLRDAFTFIELHTDRTDRFLALMPDGADLALIMDRRPVYIGYAGHLAHLGLNWRERGDTAIQVFDRQECFNQVDYIFYGPVEKKYFPQIRFPCERAYIDPHVTIYRVER